MASEERLEILRMLRDQKLTADEAERLLRALEEGNAAAQEPRWDDGADAPPDDDTGQHHHNHHHRGHHAHHQRGGPWRDRGGFWRGLAGVATLQEGWRDFAQWIQFGVQSSMWTQLGEPTPNLETLESIPVVDNTFELEPGVPLLVIHRGGGHVKLEAAPELPTVVEGEILRVGKDGERAVLLLGSDHPVLRVGRGVHSVKVLSAGSDMSARDVGCAITLKTLGGDIVLEGCRDPFTVHTMGGDVDVHLSNSHGGKGRVDTAGGDVVITLDRGFAGTVLAHSTGGSVKVDRALAAESNVEHRGRHRAMVALGPKESQQSNITASTLGGDVKLRLGGA